MLCINIVINMFIINLMFLFGWHVVYQTAISQRVGINTTGEISCYQSLHTTWVGGVKPLSHPPTWYF